MLQLCSTINKSMNVRLLSSKHLNRCLLRQTTKASSVWSSRYSAQPATLSQGIRALQTKSILNNQAQAQASSNESTPESEQPHHAVVSTFDLFSIGIGPSSSHTVGPMRAGKIFVNDLVAHDILEKVHMIRVDLYGSLALTGVGHGTPNAVLMGLEGEAPETVETSTIISRVEAMNETKSIKINGTRRIKFDPERDVVFHNFESLPQHPNGMRVTVMDENGDMLATNEYFSVGGGFVVNEATQVNHGENMYYKSYEPTKITVGRKQQDAVIATLPFINGENLATICNKEEMTIAQVVYENELRWRDPESIKKGVMAIWNTMDGSIRNGCLSEEALLPGRLNVRRRAPNLYQKLTRGLFNMTPNSPPTNSSKSSTAKASSGTALSNRENHPLAPSGRHKQAKRMVLPALDYLSVYAIAVNEENAAGGRVVTAPTNGASGVIPAVLKYYLEFISVDPERDIMEFLLTAAAVGMLFKRGASISAAEMGCQGEVGVACSMSAAAFASVMGGTVEQVLNAAEIGMEHNLGLTCDPIDGLVQIPCIERNALGAVKAVTAAQLALNGDGHHRVSLDQCIESMRQTGVDMMSKYKETSQGGLAVNVPVC